MSRWNHPWVQPVYTLEVVSMRKQRVYSSQTAQLQMWRTWESTHQEADTRVILHSVYSVQNEGVERVIIHANDTDVIITCVYYAATLLRDLPELWVRTARDSYLPIHEIAAVLDPAKSRALPFIQSLWT